jgi:hypothetical protein
LEFAGLYSRVLIVIGDRGCSDNIWIASQTQSAFDVHRNIPRLDLAGCELIVRNLQRGSAIDQGFCSSEIPAL